MKVYEEQSGVAQVICFDGTMAGSGLDRAAESVAGIMSRDQRRKIIFDLAGVDKIDSGGAGFLIAMYKNAAASGKVLTLCCPRDGAQVFLIEVGLDRLMNIHSSLEIALESF